MRKYPPSNRSSEKPLSNGQFPLFLLEKKLEKILHMNCTKPLGELLLRAKEISSSPFVRSPLINIA